MELYEEEVNQKKSKTPMIIGICIVILVIITIILVYGIMYLKNSITIINIDGKRNTEIEKIFYFETTSEGQELYIPITEIAPFLGYKGYIGDYKNKSEDKTKCYVEGQFETAMFSVNSDIVAKVNENSEYEYIKIDKPVFEKDEKLYITIDGIQKAFNVVFSSDNDFKNIEIYSMNYLLQTHAMNLKLQNYSNNFSDQKAILQGIIIVQENGQYGLIDVTSKQYILQTKYQEIKYFPTTSNFLVKSNGKYGVVAEDAKIVIRSIYDDIKVIDSQNGLYLVRQNNTFGIVNSEGDIIIEPEYNQIGININRYAQNGVENQYIFFDEIIPIKNDQELWGFFNTKGEKITDFKYTNIGCESTQVNNSYPVLIIPSHKIIVVKNDKYYNLMTVEGEELIPGFILDTVYLKSNTETAENQFYMTYNNNEKVINIEEWLSSIGR